MKCRHLNTCHLVQRLWPSVVGADYMDRTCSWLQSNSLWSLTALRARFLLTEENSISPSYQYCCA